MDRARFEHLLDAYGADFARWPAAERQAGAAYAEQHRTDTAEALARAGELDAMLQYGRGAEPDIAALSARVLAAAPQPVRGFGGGARWALAACALLGVVAGYGGGLLAPAAIEADDAYFAMAFEAPAVALGEDG